MAQNKKDDELREGLSAELDELSSDLVGVALDRLADEGRMDVLLVLQDSAGQVQSLAFNDDGIEQMLEEAHQCVRQAALKEPAVLRYVLAYEGAVDTGEGYADALLFEFGEKGWKSYSAFSLVEGKGTGDGFAWTEPAPAGELESPFEV